MAGRKQRAENAPTFLAGDPAMSAGDLGDPSVRMEQGQTARDLGRWVALCLLRLLAAKTRSFSPFFAYFGYFAVLLVVARGK